VKHISHVRRRRFSAASNNPLSISITLSLLIITSSNSCLQSFNDQNNNVTSLTTCIITQVPGQQSVSVQQSHMQFDARMLRRQLRLLDTAYFSGAVQPTKDVDMQAEAADHVTSYLLLKIV
jgi:hypothetical protein